MFFPFVCVFFRRELSRKPQARPRAATNYPELLPGLNRDGHKVIGNLLNGLFAEAIDLAELFRGVLHQLAHRVDARSGQGVLRAALEGVCGGSLSASMESLPSGARWPLPGRNQRRARQAAETSRGRTSGTGPRRKYLSSAQPSLAR